MPTKTSRIRIRLKAYDHKVLDLSVSKIVDVAEKTGAEGVGPIPLPTERQLRSRFTQSYVHHLSTRIPVNSSKSEHTSG